MFAYRYRPGDKVIFSKQKHGTHPTPRAKHLVPSQHGELYTYEVEKHWVVADVLADGRIVAQTRRGKRHVIACDDPCLRPVRWWQLWRLVDAFPTLERPSAA